MILRSVQNRSVAGYSIKLIFFGRGRLSDSHRVRKLRSNRRDNILNSENRVMNRYRQAAKVFRMCDVACKDRAVYEAQILCN